MLLIIKFKVIKAGDFKEFTAEAAKGKWAVYVFYPADFTFVCPTELGDLADKYELNSKKLDAKSTLCQQIHTSYIKHGRMPQKQSRKIKYPMLADPTGKLTRGFDVMIEEEGMALRGSFVVNPEGVIKAYEIHDNGIGRDADELLRKVQAAQFVAAHGDQVCPAKWKPGQETLTPSLDLVGKL